MDESIEFLYWKLKQYEYETYLAGEDTPKFRTTDLVYVKDYDWLKEHGFSANTCFEVFTWDRIVEGISIIGYTYYIVPYNEDRSMRKGFWIFEHLLEYDHKNEKG